MTSRTSARPLQATVDAHTVGVLDSRLSGGRLACFAFRLFVAGYDTNKLFVLSRSPTIVEN